MGAAILPKVHVQHEVRVQHNVRRGSLTQYIAAWDCKTVRLFCGPLPAVSCCHKRASIYGQRGVICNYKLDQSDIFAKSER